MNTKQHQAEWSEVQTSISRVALSLDSFLMNGIPFGVIPRAGIDGFLEHVASILLRDLDNLEARMAHYPAAKQPKSKEVLGALRTRCQQLIDVLTELRSFPTFSREHLRSTLSRIPLLRAECVQLIQELESACSIPQSCYQARPAHSTASVSAFLAHLERLFAEELATSTAG